MNSEYDKIIKLNSLIVALIILAPTLSDTLANGLGVATGANLYTLIAIIGLYMVKIVKQASGEIKLEWNFTYKTAIILLLVLILYFFTRYTSGGEHNYSIIQLLFYAIIPILATTIEIKTEYVLRYAVYMSFLTIIGLEGFFHIRWSGVEQADMGKVYSLVTVLTCTLFHIRYYRNKSNLFMKLCYLYNGYVLVRVLMVANRGALLAILFTIYVAFIYKFDDSGQMKRQTTKKILIISITIAVSLVIANNLGEIIDWAIGVCSDLFGSAPAALRKMRLYIRADDVSNGRSDINEVVYKAIKESPIIGHGLNMFMPYTNNAYPYPHNFILQYLFEGGILFAALPVFYSVGALVKVLLSQVKQKEQFVFVAMLVCQCFPKLLVSTNVWLVTAIWMLVVYSANNLFDSSRKRVINARSKKHLENTRRTNFKNLLS